MPHHGIKETDLTNGNGIASEYRRNKLLFILTTLSLTAASNFYSSGYVQTYMLNRGMTARVITLRGLAESGFSLLAYLMFILYRPKNGSYKPMLIAAAAVMVLYPLSLILSSFTGVGMAAVMIICFTGVYVVASAFRASAEFSLAPFLFPRREYGGITGRSSFLGCLVAACFSAAALILPITKSGNGVYMVFFGLAAGLLGLGTLLSSRYRLRPPKDEEAAPVPPLRDTLLKLKNRAFLLRMLPHLLRGAGAAGVYYFVLVGVSHTPLTPTQSGALVVVGILAQMLGSFLFLRLTGRVRSGVIVCCGAAVMSACLIAVSLIRGVIPLLSLYFVLMTVSYMVDVAVPVGVVLSTTTQELPLVSSARMMATMTANFSFIGLLGGIIETRPLVAMGILAAVFAAAGVLFFRQFTDTLSAADGESQPAQP